MFCALSYAAKNRTIQQKDCLRDLQKLELMLVHASKYKSSPTFLLTHEMLAIHAFKRYITLHNTISHRSLHSSWKD